jgi:putative transposase
LEMKKGILDIIDLAVAQGVKLVKACALIQIDERRIQRWHGRNDRLEDISPGPIHAPHALLYEEKEAMCTFALDPDYVDDSHRVLAAKGADKGLFFVSASSMHKVMLEKNLTADRSDRSHKNGRSTAPARPEIDGPDQRWCWDITYCQTRVKGIFLYLFTLLDEYSRKVIAWRISWHMNHKEAMEMMQEGLEKENLTDVDIKLPDLINDRGTQMKAKAFMAMCKTIGIEQKFARPRTPNDNPFIESLFSTVKGYHSYPEMFTDDIEAIVYFTEFFEYYNNERYHGKIGFVTPIQKHDGLDIDIIKKRKVGATEAKKNRLHKNRNTKTQTEVDKLLAIV